MARVYLNQAQLLLGDEHKKDRGDLTLKAGQLESQIIADQRALNLFAELDQSDPELYSPVIQ